MADEGKKYKVTNNAVGPRQILTPTGGTTIWPGESKTVTLTENEVKALKPYTDTNQLQLSEPDPEIDETVLTGDNMGFSNGAEVEATPARGDIVPTGAEVGSINRVIVNDIAPAGEVATVAAEDAEAQAGNVEQQGGAFDASADLPPEDNFGRPTNVKHRGYGRWYGMAGEEVITEAMNRSEAEAYGQEHNVPLGNEPNPSEEAQETAEPSYPPPAPDETTGQA